MASIFDLFKKIEGERATPAGPPAYLLVGLGNPGDKYTYTRHNVGFLALDSLAELYGVRIDRARFKAMVGEATLEGHRVLLMKPQTFMNLSGTAVREAAYFYNIPPEHIIVIYDDVNLDVARLRVRGKGSDGGHNGIKSIVAELGSDAFPRIRIGVGKKPHPDYDLADWVLSELHREERELLAKTVPTVREGVSLLLKGELSAAMSRCNGALPC